MLWHNSVSGVDGAEIAFLAHQEEVEARMEDGDFSSWPWGKVVV
jgi:hypothetical protein